MSIDAPHDEPRQAQTPPHPFGQKYWRSLDEFAESPAFKRWVENEFPPAVAEKLRGPSRREVLRLMAASFALAGVTGCDRPPPELIVPRVRTNRASPPVTPLYFATSLTLGGYARGVLVESFLGRPIKVEGNPDHPASLGATDVFAQAATLELYDPDRSQAVIDQGDISTWAAFSKSFGDRLELAHRRQGGGFRLLTGPTTSPTLMGQISDFLSRWPEVRWHVHAPVGRSNTLEGARIAFGQSAEPVLRVGRADVIVSLADDFLFAAPGHLRHAREFADARRLTGNDHASSHMNRLYVAEPSPTVTGAKADHRLPARPGLLGLIASALLQELQLPVSPSFPVSICERLPQRASRWVRAAARDLKRCRGRSVVTVGESLPASLHAIAHAINVELGNVGQTVDFISPIGGEGHERAGTLRELVEALEGGDVETLLILDANPVYNAPNDLKFPQLLERASWSGHMGLYHDETARKCQWHLPMTHELESWGDARAFDGTAGIIQPLIHPLYAGRSALTLLGQMQKADDVEPREQVKRYWGQHQASRDLDTFWTDSLRRGTIEGTMSPALSLTLLPDAAIQTVKNVMDDVSTDAPRPLELHFAPDPTVWDGRFANNGWLQELPKPITKLTWDNAALVNPHTAKRFGIEAGQIVELHLGERMLAAPVWITPGQSDDCVTLTLGYGRRSAGRVGTHIGADAYQLRTARDRWFVKSLTLRPTDGRHALAVTQHHHAMHGESLIKSGALATYREDPASIVNTEEVAEALSLYPQWPNDSPQWGMVIDLQSCIGCNACVLACQAENNSPVVGKEEVLRGREMHWIRIDRYYEDDPDDPRIHHQPVPCMHCENAPCEVVCPVNATTHSRDGLNEMTYNRCIGTRYCSNNCPYKVRRFNFLHYTDDETASLRLLRNPDVTVRGRGVMEKCTYCVQRIRQTQITARKEDRPIADGEVVTACQQVCPTQAIVFGNIRDPQSAVSVARRQLLHYGLLTHLNTRPRTTYLGSLRNENAEVLDKPHGRARSIEAARRRTGSA